MKDRILWFICCLYLLPATSSYAQDFSAILVTRSTQGSVRAKFSSGKNRLRLDVSAQQHSKNSSQAVTLWSVDEKMWISSGKDKPDYDTVVSNGLKLSYFTFHPSDAEDLCGQYLAQTERRAKVRDRKDISTARLVCREAGSETLDGRDTRKIAVGHSANGESPEAEITLWIAPSLHSVIKMAKKESEFSMQLENIKESAQSEKLFQIPAEASRID